MGRYHVDHIETGCLSVQHVVEPIRAGALVVDLPDDLVQAWKDAQHAAHLLEAELNEISDPQITAWTKAAAIASAERDHKAKLLRIEQQYAQVGG